MFRQSISITGTVLIFVALVCAQESPDGHWEGAVKEGNFKIRITLDLAKNAKSEWIARVDAGFGDQPTVPMPVQSVKVNGASVSIEMTGSKLELTLGAGGTMKGTSTEQQGPSASVEFKRTGEAKIELILAAADHPGLRLFKAMHEAESNRPEEALKSFEKLTELKPRESGAWVGKGQMLAELKRYDEALKAFDQGIALDPKHETAWNNRSYVLLRLGKYDESIKSYDKAIELAPKSADSFYYRAGAYAGKGDKTNALTDLKHALELQPSLKVDAVKEVGLKDLHSDPDFKKLVIIATDTGVSGIWTAKMGAATITFIIQAKGTMLTGTINNTSFPGDKPISNGKINGDEVSFSVVRTVNDVIVNALWKGKFAGDEIKFVCEIEGREGSATKITAQRVK
jgi:tetratricopeptide (TPR) repeat protein